MTRKLADQAQESKTALAAAAERASADLAAQAGRLIRDKEAALAAAATGAAAAADALRAELATEKAAALAAQAQKLGELHKAEIAGQSEAAEARIAAAADAAAKRVAAMDAEITPLRIQVRGARFVVWVSLLRRSCPLPLCRSQVVTLTDALAASQANLARATADDEAARKSAAAKLTQVCRLLCRFR